MNNAEVKLLNTTLVFLYSSGFLNLVSACFVLETKVMPSVPPLGHVLLCDITVISSHLPYCYGQLFIQSISLVIFNM
jgi:hypothetical protein